MLISVFTPTYNRSGLLVRLFDSLVAQSFGDFEWIVVDDGSTDDTETIIKELSQGSNFPIHYIKQNNGGKHRAINRGLVMANGELFFIADSDDYLMPDALHIVAEEFNKIRNDNSFAGLAGLDIDTGGSVIGSGLPEDCIDCNAMDIRYKYHVTGDLKEVFKTKILKQYPFPEIDGEKFCPEQLVWFRIAQQYNIRYINKALYVADYQVAGITAAITRMRMNSPVASIMTYSELTQYKVSLKQKIKAAINYWRFRFCAKDKITLPTIPYQWVFVIPVSFVMHLNDLKNK